MDERVTMLRAEQRRLLLAGLTRDDAQTRDSRAATRDVVAEVRAQADALDRLVNTDDGTF